MVRVIATPMNAPHADPTATRAPAALNSARRQWPPSSRRTASAPRRTGCRCFFAPSAKAIWVAASARYP
jgi:hypothetical protein